MQSYRSECFQNLYFTSDVLPILEQSLDMSQKVSLIFLLHDDYAEVYEKIMQITNVYGSSKYELLDTNLIQSWASLRPKNWKEKLIEALLIIQAHREIKMLGLDLSSLWNSFLPKCMRYSKFLILLKKVLYYACQVLTTTMKIKLVGHKIESKTERFYCMKYFELFLMKLAINGHIKISFTKDTESNVTFFTSVIEEFHELCCHLIAIENLAKTSKNSNSDVDVQKLIIYKTRVIFPVTFNNVRLNTSLGFNTLQYLENTLSVREKISLSFLLYEHYIDIEKQIVLTKSLQDRKKTNYEYQFFKDNVNLLHNFRLSGDNDQKVKIFEALLIINANQQLKYLNIEVLKTFYLFPDCLQNSLYIHPYKKALYAICESLDGSDRKKIIDAVQEQRQKEKHKIITDDTDILFFEIFLFKLEKFKYISFSSWKLEDSHSKNTGDSNFSQLCAVLKILGYNYQINVLESCQNKYNKNGNNTVNAGINLSGIDDCINTFKESDAEDPSEEYDKLILSSEILKRYNDEATGVEVIDLFSKMCEKVPLTIVLLYNLEGFLSLDECCSLVFLLYEDFKEAIERLKITNRNTLECHMYNVRLFSDYNHGKIDFWREKLIEGCFIIQNSRILDICDIDNNCDKFIPNDLPLSFFIHPIKKTLHKISKLLTEGNKRDIIKAILLEKDDSIETCDEFYVKYFEFFLLKLLDESYITIGSWMPKRGMRPNTNYIKPNICRLLNHLKNLNCIDAERSLEVAERIVNSASHKGNKISMYESGRNSHSPPIFYFVTEKIRIINMLHRNDSQESLLIPRIKEAAYVYSGTVAMAVVFLLDDSKKTVFTRSPSETELLSESELLLETEPLSETEFEMFLNDWALAYGKYWREKIFETVLITELYTEILNYTNVNFISFKNLFLPKSIEGTLLVHPVKKALYTILESLTVFDKCKLFSLIFEQSIEEESFFVCLSHLIAIDFITLGSWINKENLENYTFLDKFVPSNVSKFGNLLKSLNFNHQYYVLKSSEIFINRQLDFIKDLPEWKRGLFDIENIIEEEAYDLHSISHTIASATAVTLEPAMSELQLYDQISLLFLIFESREEYQLIKMSCSQGRCDLLGKWISEKEESKEEWKGKLIEALLIIRPILFTNFINVHGLTNYYLPKVLNKYKFIHPVKKVLQAMCEAMDTNDRLKIVESISREGKFSTLREPFDTTFFELYLIKLIDEEFITLGTWNGDRDSCNREEFAESNVRNLALHLMKSGFNEWCDKLMTSEKKVNRNSQGKIDNILKYNADREGKYCIDSKSTGMAIIINQKKFYKVDESSNKIETLKERTGTDEDRNRLIKVWESLGFKPITFNDLERDDIIPSIVEAILTNAKEDHGAFVLCVLSHGDRGAVYGSDTLVVGVDKIVKSLDSLTILKGKPKILIIQCCQGTQHLTSVTIDSDSSENYSKSGHMLEKMPWIDDLLVFWSTIPGHLSYRDNDGTWFIKTLCANLEENGHLKSFLDICIDINGDLSSQRRGGYIQMSEFSYTLRKQLYFEQAENS